MATADKYGTLLKIFFGAFIALFVVGLSSGGLDRKDQVHATALRGVGYVDSKTGPVMTFRCGGSTQLIFDLANAHVIENPTAIGKFQITNAVFSLASHRSALLAFAGGSTGAITLQSLAKTSAETGKASRAQTIFATAFGAVSGYLIGYWLATLNADQCDSPAVRDMVREEAFWRVASREVLAIRIHELGYRDTRFGNDATPPRAGIPSSFASDPLVRCPGPLSEALRKAVENISSGSQPTLADYKAIITLERLRIRLASLDVYRALVSDAEAKLEPVTDPFTSAILPHETTATFQQFCASLPSKMPEQQ